MNSIEERPENNCTDGKVGKARQSAPFFTFWFGETTSLFGSQITLLALPLTAVLLFHADALQLGLLNTAISAPFLLITLFAGVWINHHRRRPLLIGANIGRALLLGLIPLFALAGWLRIEYLYIIAFLAGCLTVFFYLAFQAFLPTLVAREKLVNANSKLSASQSIAEIGGPGLAGLLIQLVTAPIAIVVDALSFCIAAGSLLLIHVPESLPDPTERQGNFLSEIRKGFQLMFRNRYLRAFAGEAATYNLFWQMILTVFLLYAVRVLGFSSGLLGLIFATGSGGALLGSLLTGFIARRIGPGSTIIVAAALGDIPLLVLPLVTRTTPGGVVILMLALFIQGVGIAGCNVHVDSIRQAIIPESLRGCANASYRLLVSGALPLGALLGGFLGNAFGLQTTLLLGACGLLSTWFWVVFSPVRTLRAFPLGEASSSLLEAKGLTVTASPNEKEGVSGSKK
jgi:MFS family permease